MEQVAWWWLPVVACVGAFAGIVIACLCHAAGTVDDEMDRFCARHDQFDEEEEDYIRQMKGHF